jgi:hypothetical protein
MDAPEPAKQGQLDGAEDSRMTEGRGDKGKRRRGAGNPNIKTVNVES